MKRKGEVHAVPQFYSRTTRKLMNVESVLL
jgi:hypothetical protein